MKLEVETRFNRGDKVTLAAMVEVAYTQGPPQILVVQWLQINDSMNGSPSAIRYHCRRLAAGNRDGEDIHQAAFYGRELTNGMVLLEEEELVAWEPPEGRA